MGDGQQSLQPPQRTPQLAGGRTLARAAPAGASLWAGAGACMPVAPTLTARLTQREAEDPEAAAARKQPLARGGTAYPVGEETRALKVRSGMHHTCLPWFAQKMSCAWQVAQTASMVWQLGMQQVSICLLPSWRLCARQAGHPRGSDCKLED